MPRSVLVLAGLLLLFAGCKDDASPAATPTPAAATRTAFAPLEAGQPDVCADVEPTSLAPGWLVGPSQAVTPTAPLRATFASTVGERAVLVLLASSPAGEGASAEARLDGAMVARLSDGAPFASAFVTLKAQNQLEVTTSSGAVRGVVFRLDPLPCTLLDVHTVRFLGKPYTVTRNFTAPEADSPRLFLLEGDATASGRVLLNGELLVELDGVTGLLPRVVLAPLAASNTLQLTITGKPGTQIRLRVMDPDHLAPIVAVGQPEADAVFTSSPIVVEGTAGRGATTVEVSGAAATFSNGVFTASAPLMMGDNPVIAIARDSCGNVARTCRRVILDSTPPVITISGIQDGDVVGKSVRLSWSAADPHLRTVSATLDGSPVESGVEVHTEGTHVLEVTATDAGGLITTAKVSFTIDLSAPTVRISGITEGQLSNAAQLVPTIEVIDEDPLVQVESTLDGQPFESGKPVTAEGLHELVVTARDRAGNTASKNVTFTLDRTAPAITLKGIDEGAFASEPVVLQYSATDPHLADVVGALDDLPFASDATAAEEGSHHLVVTATDRAGNRAVRELRFILDFTAPAIQVTGIWDGEATSALQVLPVFSATDVHAFEVEAVLDGASFKNGDAVTSEAEHRLVVRATDQAGNTGTREVRFAIDRTAPAISITGVKPDEARATAFTIHFAAEDLHFDEVLATVDGQPFLTGGTIDTEGTHILVVNAGDRAGNLSRQELRFTLDATPPSIAVTGVNDGQVSGAASLTPRFAVTDATALEVLGELDGAPFTDGTAVSAEGAHTLVVKATDAAGNKAEKTFRFTLDRTVPVISTSGLTDGQFSRAPLTLTFSATDAHLKRVEATLDGAPFNSGTEVASEGSHTLVVVAFDEAGNEARSELRFTLDFTDPVLELAGFVDGQMSNSASVTPTFSATDANFTTLTATLDGDSFTSGTAVTKEGTHVLVVVAKDRAGNEARAERRFTIDRSDPEVVVSGVISGQHYRAPVTVTYSATDSHLKTVTAVLNGASFTSGAVVDAERAHLLVVTAQDEAGNKTVVTVAFTLDLTPPAISVSGVSDGQFTNAASVAPTFAATDANEVSVSAKLDGQSFASGSAVTAEGTHTLVIDAHDPAGNTAQKSLTFTIDRTAPQVTVAGVVEGERRNTPATPTFSATDAHLASIEATLDGASFVSGSAVSAAGPHALTVIAKDKAGNQTQVVRHFTIDTTDPSVAFVAPANGFYTASAALEVIATAADEGGVASVKVGALALALGEDGKYRGTVPLQEGENALTLLASDAAGNTASASRTVHRDSAKPQLVVTAPTEGATTPVLSTTVKGSVTDATAVTVKVNGSQVELAEGGSFSHAVTLTEGTNTLTVTATDLAGNTETVSRTVKASVQPPSLTVSEPSQGFTTTAGSIVVKGKATPSVAGEALSVWVKGAQVTTDAEGYFERTVALALGSNTIDVFAVDPRGLRASVSLQGTRASDSDGGTVGPDGGTVGSDAGTPDGSPGTDAGLPDTSSPPVLQVESPSDELLTNGETVAVSGRISGGTEPFTVTIGTVRASVTGHSFGTALPLAEGSHTLAVQVTDAQGRTASMQRKVTVDRTRPFLSITRPDEATTVVAESPYRFEGQVGDVHLAGVSVQGVAATVIAGQYRAYVSLPAGTSQVSVVATDLAGNREVRTRTLTINGAPPVVSIVEPLSGSEAAEAVVTVRAKVTSNAPIQSVQIGTGSATEVAPGEYTANIPLSLGENTLTVIATDALGLQGSASVQVRFRDPTTEPLRVTGVSPATGETEIQPDSLISVAFNKPVDPESLEGNFEVLHDGDALSGGFSVAPGGQTATFIAAAPLPEGARLTVRVSDLEAVTGPDQDETYVSEFDVRRPLTRLRGVVTDDEFRPLPGVLVTLEGQGVSTRSGPDGNWAVIGAKGGQVVVRYEGGLTADGRPMPTVRRRLYVTPEGETVDERLPLTPMDSQSREQVDGSSAVHLTFNGRQGALSVDLPASGLTFESGQMAGQVTATRLEPYALPVPLEGKFGLTGVWQLTPAGARLNAAAELQFPNLTGLPAGRRALLFTYDPNRHVIQHSSFGVVTADGKAIRSEQPVEARSLEFIGYMGLSEEQHAAVEAVLASNGGAGSLLDGGTERLLAPPVPFWKRALNELVGVAHAQLLLFNPAVAALQTMIANAIPASVTGVVRAPREQMLSVEINEPASDVLLGQYEVPENTFALDLGFTVRQELGLGMDVGTDTLRAELQVTNPDGSPQGAQAGASWTSEGQGTASLNPTVALKEGLTKLTLSAKMGSAHVRYTRLEARLEQMPEGAPVLPPYPGAAAAPEPTPGVKRYKLAVRRVFDSAEDGDKAFQSVVRFEGLRVTITGPGNGWSGITGQTGGYGVLVPVPEGASMGISCADMRLGTRPIAIQTGDAGTGVRTELVSADFPSCSPTYEVAPGSAMRADILFDVRMLKGSLTFVDRKGVPLPSDCEEDAETERDPETGDVVRLASQDVTATEVHFFREDNLELPIARYTVGAPRADACTAPAGAAHGHYARIRPGPATPTKQRLRIRCAEILAEYGGNVPKPNTPSDDDPSFYWGECVDNRRDFLRLSPGDRIVAVAVNHATGYTGMSRVVVPPINKVTRDADGKCAADEAAGGLLEVIEHGETMYISRCAEQEVAIQGNIKLFPPEIDVRVARRAPEEGLRRDALPMFVRQGGAATSRDDYVHVSTHWRVRTAAPGAGTDGGSDGGFEEPDAGACDGGAHCEPCTDGRRPDGGYCFPGMLVDEGDAGHRLELYCSELLPTASDAQRATCLPNDLELAEVPAGVPPLAGQIIRVTGAAVEEPAVVAFKVKPGRASAAVHASMKIKDAQGGVQVLNSLKRATYYLHVVGQSVFPRDTNADDKISDGELIARPPNFEWDAERDPMGLPTQAVQLKNVYRSLEPNGTKVERYDLSREHEFRVIELTSPNITARSGADQRSLKDEDKPSAQETDLSYQFFTTLMEVPLEDKGRADVMPGEYTVRLGSDEYGIECPLKITAEQDKRTLSADCDGEFLPEVISASDLLYIELYLSGNAENILYRFNFHGLAPRSDYLSAGSSYSAPRSVELYNGKPVLDRSFSLPAILSFYVDPTELMSGQIRLCVDEKCSGEVLKKATLAFVNGSYQVTVDEQTPSRGGKLRQLKESGLYGVRRFRMPVPAELAEMAGTENPNARTIYLVLDAETPRIEQRVRALGKPKGSFVGTNARAAGQEALEGVNLSDGHLSFSHEDFAVPHYAETVRFVRTYNNQNNLVGSLGIGWTHNFEGQVLEEAVGRYTVLLNGQSYDFPKCTALDVDAGTASNCVTDKAHGLTLAVGLINGKPDVTVTTSNGWTYKFDQRAEGEDEDGRRRWLLTRYEDGHGRGNEGNVREQGWTYLSYVPKTNLVDTVEREPGRLKLKFEYQPFSDAADVSFRLKHLARTEKLQRLHAVNLLNSGTTLHRVEFDHDARNNNLKAARRITGAPSQTWRYDYEPRPEGVSGNLAWAAANEMETARFEIGGATQWYATYVRSADTKAYPHVNAGEFVTLVRGTGHPDADLKVVPESLTRRLVTRPDGVQLQVDLNEYGNVVSTRYASGGLTSALTWESNNRGGLPGARDGRVYSTSSTSPLGLKVERTPDDRLRTNVTAVMVAPSGALPVAKLQEQPLSQVNERDEKGRATNTSFSTAAGLGTTSTPRNASGDLTKLEVKSATGATAAVIETTPDADGVVLSGKDAFGNVLTYGGFTDQALYLPTSLTAMAQVVSSGGLREYSETRGYDSYGRLTLSRNETTGRVETWTYDALGRLLQHTLNSTPAQTRSYLYEQAADTLTVTESLNGQSVRKSVTRKGLLDSETVFYGEGQEASASYKYEGGRLKEWTDLRGFTWTNVYNSSKGWLEDVKLTAGPGVEGEQLASHFERDGEGKPLAITNEHGLVTRIGYDALGRAVERNYGNNDIETVELDANGTEIRRSFGIGKRHILSTQADALGRPLKRWNGIATEQPAPVKPTVLHETTYYDGAGRVTGFTDGISDLEESFTYGDVLGRMTERVRTVRAGAAVRKLTETRKYTDAGARSVVLVTLTIEGPTGTRKEESALTLDVAGRVLSRTAAVPEVGDATHLVTYDARGNVLTSTPEGLGTTKRTYDAQGNLLRVEEPEGATTVLTVDPTGLVLTKAGPHAEESWTYVYDAFGRLTEKKLAAAGTTPEAKWTYSYEPGGKIVEVDPRKFSSTRTLNPRGQVESETRAGTSSSLTSRYEYDGPWLRLAETEEGSWRNTLRREPIDDLGRPTVEEESWTGLGAAYTYRTSTDWEGRNVHISQDWSMGGAGAESRRQDLELDSLGNVIRKVQGGLTDELHYDAAGVLVKASPAGMVTPRTYSYENGYLTQETFATEITEYRYYRSGNLRLVTEPSERERSYEYNARGMVSKETYGRGNEVTTTRYEYDGAGNRKSMTHGASSPVTWLYDHGPLGELRSVTPPGELGTFQYSYYPDGQLAKVQPPEGPSPAQEFDYDFLGRQTRRTRGTSTWATEWRNGAGLTRLPNGNSREQFLDGRGRLAKVVYTPGDSGTADVTDLFSVEYLLNGADQPYRAIETRRNAQQVVNSYGYDQRNQLLSVSRGTDAVGYTYTNFGQRQTVTVGANTVTYGYNILGRLESISAPNNPPIQVQWEPGGSRVNLVADSRASERYCYDGVGRVRAVASASADPGCDQPPANPIAYFKYLYDERGNREEERYRAEGVLGEELTKYVYDEADRLKVVTYPDKRVEYTLHPEGSRKSELHVGANGARLQELTYAYGPLGSLDSITEVEGARSTTTFRADAAGQVVSRSSPSESVAYHWDAAGRLARVTKTPVGAASSSVSYRYDHAGLRRQSIYGNETVDSVWGAGELVEERRAAGVNRYVYGPGGVVILGGERIVHDALGSAVARIRGANGTTTPRFDAWGTYREGSAPSASEPSIGYTGHAYDADTGLTYAQQRWLDTTTGRFLSEDPIGAGAYLATPHGLNAWLYANGNPTRFTDPTGERARTEAEEQWIKYLTDQGFGEYAERLSDAIVRAKDGELIYSESMLEHGSFCLPSIPGELAGPPPCYKREDGSNGPEWTKNGPGGFPLATLVNFLTQSEYENKLWWMVEVEGSLYTQQQGQSDFWDALELGGDVFKRVTRRGGTVARDPDEPAKRVRFRNKKALSSLSHHQRIKRAQLRKSQPVGHSEADPLVASAGAWERPKGWRLPKNGTWAGQPGHSDFIPASPRELGLQPGEVIPFRAGRPDFSKWSQGNFTSVESLDGNHEGDMPKMHRTIAQAKGWTVTQVRQWLSEQQLTPHHSSGNDFQLIPWRLHGNPSAVPPINGVRHQSGAYDLRNSNE